MTRFVYSLLSEKSEVSTTRAMGIVCVLCACGLAIYGIHMNRDLLGLAALCSAFIGPAFAGKVIQKFKETNQGNQGM
jgi:Na+/proline symporter